MPPMPMSVAPGYGLGATDDTGTQVQTWATAVQECRAVVGRSVRLPALHWNRTEMMSSNLRWGLLSTARINDLMVDAIGRSERSELRAVASRDAESARSYAAERRIPTAHGSYEGLLDDPSVDAVYVSLPNALHAEWSVKAVRSGKHVLCEKPLATAARDVSRMTQGAVAASVVLQEAVAMRFHPQTRKVRELVKTSVIGEVRVLRGSFTYTVTRSDDIRLDPVLDAGSLWDIGCYPISLFQAALRSQPHEVFGWARKGPSGVDLSFAGQVKYESGAFAQIFSSLDAARSWSAEFVGDKGLMRVDYPWLSQIGVTSNIRVSSFEDADPAAMAGSSSEPLGETTFTFEDAQAYVDEVAGMESMILDGADLVVPHEDSELNVRTIEAPLHSAALGRPIQVTA